MSSNEDDDLLDMNDVDAPLDDASDPPSSRPCITLSCPTESGEAQPQLSTSVAEGSIAETPKLKVPPSFFSLFI